MMSFTQGVNRIRSHVTLISLSILGVVFMCQVLSQTPVVAGTLDPPADAFTGSGDPAPTMKELDQIPPTWSRILPASKRWEVLTNPIPVFPGFEAWGVLDRETGLVWEQSPRIPGPAGGNENKDWVGARFACLRHVGGRGGWRVPSVHELQSLTDLSNQNPALPTGHPFSNIQNGTYWSATKNADSPSGAWDMNMGNGSLSTSALTNTYSVWCVRGGGPLTQY